MFIELNILVISSLLASTDGLKWSEDLHPVNRAIEYRLLNSKGDATSIFYLLDSESRGVLKFNAIDSESEIIATAPGSTLWEAHPEKVSALERFFEESLTERDLNVKTLDDLIRQIESRVSSAQRELLGLLDNRLLRGVKNQLIARDVIEPIRTEVGHAESRFDAFNLFALRVLRDHRREFLGALFDLASHPERFPLEWLVSSRNQFSLDTRMAVLSCLTHNHFIETTLIQAVSLDEGREVAWAVAKAINNIYQGERDYWIHRPELRQVANEAPQFPSGIGFLDVRQAWQVNVAMKPRVLEPVFGMKPSNHLNEEELLPYFQLYHYYGAFFVSWRLETSGGISEDLLPTVVESLGMTYKIKSMGWNKKQILKMKNLYRRGAEDYLRFKDFL